MCKAVARRCYAHCIVRVCCFVVFVHLQPYGEVLKIITFHKNGIFKALVQLSSVDAAVNARLMLEGKDIFQGRDDKPEPWGTVGVLAAAAAGRRVWRLTSRLMTSLAAQVAATCALDSARCMSCM